MFSEITKFDFLVKEFFKAQFSGNKSAENYYLLELMSHRQSDLGRLSNKYTRLGQHGSGNHKYEEKKINEKYDFFLLQTIPKTIDAVTQTDNILEIEKVSEIQLLGNKEEIEKVSEIQLLGNKEEINEEVFEDNF